MKPWSALRVRTRPSSKKGKRALEAQLCEDCAWEALREIHLLGAPTS